jgi:hypothetical protein
MMGATDVAKVVKQVAKYLQQNEGTESARILGELMVALDSGGAFRVNGLYELPFDAFELALDLLKHWRLKHYTSRPGDLAHALAMEGFAAAGRSTWQSPTVC